MRAAYKERRERWAVAQGTRAATVSIRQALHLRILEFEVVDKPIDSPNLNEEDRAQ